MSKRSGRQHEPPWANLSEDELLDWRICDLGVSIQGGWLEERIERLYWELESREISFRPHCWLSEDWFSPEGVPGIAIPFFLAHPRLARLERSQMLEVEGGTKRWCLRILRHEAGHAIDTAYALHRLRRWQAVFGKSSQPYPDEYQPKPYSKSFVRHLENWYAQSHPDEDFAETFAVWVKPRSNWRAQYEGWPAKRKLEFVDQLISEIRDQRPVVKSRERVEPVRRIRKTLRTHYREKRQRYGVDAGCSFDSELRRLFSDSPEFAQRISAASFLRRHRGELVRVVAKWTGQYKYAIDQVLREMIARCAALGLRVHRPAAETRRDVQVMLTVQTMHYLHSGHHRIAL
ncbi:MAG: putative zinc-binding metallopeptidase [Planctomycetota bacterium]